MTTDRQIASNRINSKKSTGPRTKRGKGMLRRNALRHGLSVDIGTDPAFCDDIEKLAKLLSLSSGARDTTESAREAAAADLDLKRIRKIRAHLLQTLCFADAAAPDGTTELNKKLAKLERYERRAFSKRKRAIRLM